MAWIESHQELGRHPKTKKLARLLGASVPATMGHLHLLWHWAVDWAPEGDLTPFDDYQLADAAMWEGDGPDFCAALVEAGYVDCFEGQRKLHDWYEYAGKLIERRKEDAERKRQGRRPADVQRMSSGQAAEVRTESVRSPSVNRNPNRNPLPTTEEAEVKPTLAATRPVRRLSLGRAVPKGKTLSPEDQVRFDRWYKPYPKHEKRPEAEKAWARLRPDDEMTARLVADVEARKLGRKWQEGFIDQPATYLNQRIWEDDIEAVRPERRASEGRIGTAAPVVGSGTAAPVFAAEEADRIRREQGYVPPGRRAPGLRPTAD